MARCNKSNENCSCGAFDERGKYLMANAGNEKSPNFVRGSGVRIEDDSGKRYIDFTTQGFTMYLGFSNPEIIEAVHEHMKNLTHVMQFFHTETRYKLAQKLAEIAPKNLNRVSFTVGGGPAIEAAMKIALKNVEKARSFITQWDGYHGGTLTTLGASSTMAGPLFDEPGKLNFLTNTNNNFIRVPNPYCYRCYFGQDCSSCNLMCAEMLRLTLQKGINGPAAGVIIEPVQSGAGQIPAPKKYLQRVREICDEFGTLLIFDEIQNFCRTGKFFAAQYYDVEPDIIVIAKGLGAGFPIAGIIIHDRLKGFESVGEELHTFSANTVSQAAALKQIEIIERDKVLDNVTQMGKHIKDRLDEMKNEFEEIGDIRQVGLLIGVELIKDAKTKEPLDREISSKIVSACYRNGLILQLAQKSILKIKPALIISKTEIDEALEILRKSLKEVLRA